MSKTFNRYTAWIVDRPIASVILLVLITVVAIIGYRTPQLFSQLFAQEANQSESQVQETEAEEFDTPPDVEAIALGAADAIIVAESDSFFTADGAEAMRAVVTALEQLPHVSGVMWLDQIPIINIFGLPEPLLPSKSAAPSRFDAAKKKALDHPLVTGQFMSADGKTMLLLLNFD